MAVLLEISTGTVKLGEVPLALGRGASTCVSLLYIEYNTISDANLVLLCILKCNTIPKWWKYGDKIGITVDLDELVSLDGFVVHTEVGVVGI